MEFYHNQLKVRLLNEKNSGVYERTDWLVDKLNTKVHSYFWLDEYSGKDAFARYRKEEWVSGLTSWRKALEISDSYVVVEGGNAKVTDQLDRDRVYVVLNPGSQFGICDCHWAEMGNLCEHILKVISIWGRKKSATPSISMLQYHKALMTMLHCPPNDSLIRDQAVSLAILLQKQINALVSESSDISKDQPISGNKGQEFVNERIEDILFQKENGFLDRHEVNGRTTGDAVGELNDLLASENAESIGEEISCAEMDIDPSSICISPPGLHSVDEVVSSGVLSEDTQKVLINSETEQLLTNTKSSADHVFKNGSQESEMDIESISMDFPPSTVEFVERCTETLQNDVKPIVISNTMDSGTLSNKTSPPIITMPVESQGDEVGATSDVKKEDKMLEA